MSDDIFESGGFEHLAEVNGDTLWSARELCQVLGYATYSSFRKGPVARAMAACLAADIPAEENFHVSREDQDVRLTRFACYLVAMNADSKKTEVAKAQAYFASIAEAFDQYLTNAEDVERVYIRSEVTEHEKGLSATAQVHGVENYGRFRNAGYRGMYNLHINEIRLLRGAPTSRSPLDYMGSRELAANLFRIQETDAKIQHDDVNGQRKLERAAFDVGARVRDFVHETGGQYPEELESADDIRRSHRRLKQAHKGFRQLDMETGT